LGRYDRKEKVLELLEPIEYTQLKKKLYCVT